MQLGTRILRLLSLSVQGSHRTRSYGMLVAVFCLSTVGAVERTILLGPKTIGKAWKDNIVLEPRHFTDAHAGDIVTVYNDNAKRTAQGAFQNPKTWQGVAPEYGYFGINGPFRMVLTDDILAIAREYGVVIGGHDYRILQVTLSDAADYQETMVWNGPSVVMKDDWSANAEIPASSLATFRVGDGLRLHVSKVKQGAAAKIMDFTWNVIDPSVDGVPVGENGYTWYIYDDAPLLKLALAGTGGNVAMRISGTGYKLDGIGIVRQVGDVSEDYSQAQRAPREYVLQPGELFHGEKVYPLDWSGYLKLTASPFQESTENDVLIISYTIDPAAKAAGITPQMSFRSPKTWGELTGAAEPIAYQLDGTDVVYMFDAVALDEVKTRGLVLAGVGFTLTKIELISAQ